MSIKYFSTDTESYNMYIIIAGKVWTYLGQSKSFPAKELGQQLKNRCYQTAEVAQNSNFVGKVLALKWMQVVSSLLSVECNIIFELLFEVRNYTSDHRLHGEWTPKKRSQSVSWTLLIFRLLSARNIQKCNVYFKNLNRVDILTQF